MSSGFFATGKHREMATFEVSIRRLPRNREWVIVAGLERVVDYLLDLSFGDEEIAYLRALPQFDNAPSGFFDYLRALRFTGDVDAVPEGTTLFAGEPVLELRAPLIEAQIPETYLLSAITFETLIATKAARIVDAAEGRSTLEFGTRRAHTPEAGTIGARAAFIGGCTGTSNALAGYRYGIPVMGTSAHSWVMSFPSETEAFRALQQLMGSQTVQLIDTYDTLKGAAKAAALGKPLWGVRIDSGDLVVVSRAVRAILDAAGLTEARIMASGDLDEFKIARLVADGAPIDSFGVGTELSTSGDAPSMGMVYKVVELREGDKSRYAVKHSEGKPSVPGAKQIWRSHDRDVVGLADEDIDEGEPLLRPLLRNGKRVAEPEPLDRIRERAKLSRESVSVAHRVKRSARLTALMKTI